MVVGVEQVVVEVAQRTRAQLGSRGFVRGGHA